MKTLANVVAGIKSPCRHWLRGLLLSVFILAPLNSQAEWTINEQSNDNHSLIASTTNNEGYSMEIYRDASNAIRARFNLVDGLLQMEEKTCPSYQIDKGIAINRSINNAPCLSGNGWAEFILGYINETHITSSSLLAIMNGINITFRFKLDNSDYQETAFSLQGSKRTMLGIFGEDTTISAN